MATTKTLLTNESFIRQAGNLDDNIQSKFLLPAIRETQEIDFQSLIGENLYDSLIEKVEDNSINNDENKYYKELIDKSQYYFLYNVISKIIIISNFKLNNIGAYTTNDENAYSVNANDAFTLQEYYTKKVDWYGRRIQEFVLDNYKHFPELTKASYHKIQKNLYSAASSPIYLGGARGKVKHYGGYGHSCNGYDKFDY